MRPLPALAVCAPLFALGCGSSSASSASSGAPHDGGSAASGDAAGAPADDGGDGGGSGGAGPHGLVYAGTSRYGAERSYFAGASFESGPSLCAATIDGACRILDCAAFDGGAVPLESAGTLSLTGGAVPVDLPFANGSYAGVSDGTRALWSGGETIAFHAAGATVPAFSGTVVAPAQVTIEAPTLPSTGTLSLPRSADLAVRWSGKSVGVVGVTVAVGARSVVCSFDAASGSGTVPAKDLGQLPAGTGNFNVFGDSSAHVAAGAWDVKLDLSIDESTPDGRRAAATVTTE